MKLGELVIVSNNQNLWHSPNKQVKRSYQFIYKDSHLSLKYRYNHSQPRYHHSNSLGGVAEAVEAPAAVVGAVVCGSEGQQRNNIQLRSG